MEFGLNQQTITVIIGLIASLWGAYNEFRKRRYKRGEEQTQKALQGIIAAIELLPEGGRKEKAKRMAKSISIYLDTESDLIFGLVKEVEKLLDSEGIRFSEQDENEKALRASAAINRARKKRKTNKSTEANKIIFFLLVGSVFACTMLFSSCSIGNHQRMTSESLWPGEQPRQIEIVVEWPYGVKAQDVYTTTVQGYAISVAPFQEIEPTEIID